MRSGNKTAGGERGQKKSALTRANTPKRLKQRVRTPDDFVVTMGLQELPDSTPEHPVVALQPYGFPIGRSLQGDVLYVANVAREEAMSSRDPLLVDCARTLDALELNLRRKRTRLAPADAAAAKSLGKIAQACLEGRREDERWHNSSLPARAIVDRAQALLALRSFAERLPMKCFERGTAGARDAALMMVTTLYRANLFDRRNRTQEDDVKALGDTYVSRSREGLRRKLTPESPVVLALIACGVRPGDAHNWCKHLSRA